MLSYILNRCFIQDPFARTVLSFLVSYSSGIEQLRQLPLGWSLHLNCLLPPFVPSQSLEGLINIVEKRTLVIVLYLK
jgi:hypothetical protein